MSFDTLGIHDDDSLDLIFIDGDHTYEGALADITIAWRKLRPGGWMLGHDCFVPEVAATMIVRDNEPNGVQRAVIEFLGRVGVVGEVLDRTNMFAVLKPSLN
jgi:predicted O-methyltransferase YrrM